LAQQRQQEEARQREEASADLLANQMRLQEEAQTALRAAEMQRHAEAQQMQEVTQEWLAEQTAELEEGLFAQEVEAGRRPQFRSLGGYVGFLKQTFRKSRSTLRARRAAGASAVPSNPSPPVPRSAIGPRRLSPVVLDSPEQMASVVTRLRGVIDEFGGMERLLLLLDALEPAVLSEVHAALFREDLRSLAQELVQRKECGVLDEEADWAELWELLPPRVASFLLHGLAPNFESESNLAQRSSLGRCGAPSLRASPWCSIWRTSPRYGQREAVERFVQVLYVVGQAAGEGRRGANWPTFVKGRMSADEERTFLREVGWKQIWTTLLPECISDLSKLPPSIGQILMQIGRANYRLAHWMRAILPTIDLTDVPLTGFMPLPGSGSIIRPDGSNAAFDWGVPEPLQQHLPEQIATLRRVAAKGGKGHDTCRAIVGPPKSRKRCGNKVHEKAGVEPGWLPCTCGIAAHKQKGIFELPEGEQWCAEVEEEEAARTAAAVASDGAGAADAAMGGVAGSKGTAAVGPLELAAADLEIGGSVTPYIHIF
jgi:hypothetical protein